MGLTKNQSQYQQQNWNKSKYQEKIGIIPKKESRFGTQKSENEANTLTFFLFLGSSGERVCGSRVAM